MISPSPSESFDNVSTFYVNVKPLSCIQEPGSLCAGNLMSNIIVIIGNVSVIRTPEVTQLILALTFLLILQVAHRFNELRCFNLSR
jgi:hypothetical protein